ncbi:MAG: hypothetical protein FJ086_08535 [Deltaproteobacteria bacterium]|nr:hypothetical protein [Deltaproteobacteria bacterium]
MNSPAPTLEEAWEATVNREASANELRVGVVRVLSFGAGTGFTVGYWL